jgi:putative FmdB family regulatory protein
MGMPTYEYVCRSCGTHVEVYQHFDDPPLTECGVCGGPLRKVFHPAGILFKGSGFYATDSRRRSASSSGESSKADEGASTSEPAAKTTEGKEPAKKPAGKEPKGGTGSKEKSA